MSFEEDEFLKTHYNRPISYNVETTDISETICPDPRQTQKYDSFTSDLDLGQQ
jgi:hypothetical protein